MTISIVDLGTETGAHDIDDPAADAGAFRRFPIDTPDAIVLDHELGLLV